MLGSLGSTLYNHMLTPNGKSCKNGSGLVNGAYTASGYHFGGVNVLYCDGRVIFTRDTVAKEVWRAISTRQGGEVVSEDR